MEPVTLILTALATGAAAGAASASESAIRDAYNGLKAVIQRQFAGKDKAERALKDYTEDPDTYEKPLAKQLQESGAAEDEAVIRAAQELMAVARPEQAAQGVYNVQVKGNVYGLVQGNQGEISQTFNFGTEK
jgi:hypothetical protein